MGSQADELKAQIDSTRADLTATMNDMGDRVSPGRIVARRTDKVRQKATSLRESVMGATDHLPGVGGDSSGETLGGSVIDGARQAPKSVVGGAQGNPLAAGLVAFGAGLLVASVLPASRAEQRGATQALDMAQPVIGHARSVGQDIAGSLEQTVTDAAQDLRSAVGDAAGEVGGRAKVAAGDVASSATDAVDDIKGQAQHSAGKVKGQARN